MDKEGRKKLFRSFELLLAVFIFGTSGYIIIEKWGFLDSLYMTVITLATIGYGEIHELSTNGRIFTIVLVVFGIGAAASVLNNFAAIIIDAKLNSFLGRRSMNNELKKMNSHVILCGFGQLGSIIAVKLQAKSIPFVVIDDNEDEIERAKQLGFLFVQGQFTSDASLINAGIKTAKALVVCVPDITVNLTLSLAAKELNPQIEVIAQGSERSFESRLIRAGADKVIYPLALGGEQISEIIAGNYNKEEELLHTEFHPIDGYYIKLYRNFSKASQPINQIIEKENGLRAIAFKNLDNEIIDNPQEDIQIKKDESIIILCNDKITGLKNDYKSEIKVIEWKKEYSVGVSSIDGEHMMLVNVINELNSAIYKGESNKILAGVFDKLIDYSLEHFKNEEQILSNCNYPYLKEHIQEHKQLIGTIMELNKSNNYTFPNNLADFLNAWLIDHILDSDKKYEEYTSCI